MLTLLASAARTVSGNSGPLTDVLPHPEEIVKARWVLNVTAAATDANDTLDVYIQTTYDGVNFDDVAHFTQVTGTGGPRTHIAEWTRDITPESEMHAPQDAAIAVGVIQGGALGPVFRVKWVVVDPTGSNASFTFSVRMDHWRSGRAR